MILKSNNKNKSFYELVKKREDGPKDSGKKNVDLEHSTKKLNLDTNGRIDYLLYDKDKVKFSLGNLSDEKISQILKNELIN